MEPRNIVFSTLPGRIRNDTTYADVGLVFEGGAVLTAHAVVLASASDCYKEALSEKWTSNRWESDSPVAHISKKRQLSRKSNTRKITLNHTNVSAETAKILLDYLYFGDVEIPPARASNVIVFANEIMVFNLVQKCAVILVKVENLSPENALALYFLCDRIHAIEDKKSIGLSKMLQNLPLSLKSGREVLAQMSGRDVETMLLYESFEPVDRWRILIAWCRACQDAEGDLSLESDLPKEFQIGAASKLIEPLLPVVELFKISAAHSSLVEPFQVLLSESMQRMLEFHLKGKTCSGGNKWKAPLVDSLHAIQKNLPVPLSSFVASDPIRLFHGEPGVCTDRNLHKARDGKPNTLTLVKLKSGSIVGGYTAEACTSLSARICPSSFTFLIAPSGGFLRLPFQNNCGGILGGPYIAPANYDVYEWNRGLNGSNFELNVKGHVLVGRMSQYVFSGFNGGGCAFIKEVCGTGSSQGAIECCEVYRMR